LKSTGQTKRLQLAIITPDIARHGETIKEAGETDEGQEIT
jgi:hypothetical protein